MVPCAIFTTGREDLDHWSKNDSEKTLFCGYGLRDATQVQNGWKDTHLLLGAT
jgi:hypothetical protein